MSQLVSTPYRFRSEDIGKWLHIELHTYEISFAKSRIGDLIAVEIIGCHEQEEGSTKVWLRDDAGQIFQRDEDEIHASARELLQERISECERGARICFEAAQRNAQRSLELVEKYRGLLTAMDALAAVAEIVVADP